MINIYPYDGETVRVKCRNGRTYSGTVTRCSPACGIDANDDLLVIGKTEMLASEIEEIKIVGEQIIDIDNYPVGIKDADYVPPLGFNAQKLVEYIKASGKSFAELTSEELNNLK